MFYAWVSQRANNNIQQLKELCLARNPLHLILAMLKKTQYALKAIGLYHQYSTKYVDEEM